LDIIRFLNIIGFSRRWACFGYAILPGHTSDNPVTIMLALAVIGALKNFNIK